MALVGIEPTLAREPWDKLPSSRPPPPFFIKIFKFLLKILKFLVTLQSEYNPFIALFRRNYISFNNI